MSKEIVSPLYWVENSGEWQCETVFGLFTSVCKWKTVAREELKDWIEANKQALQNQDD